MILDPAEMGELAGAGGLLSTGEDMLKILETLVTPNSTWQPILEEAAQPINTINSETEIAYSIDIYSNDEDVIYAKSGSQMGYSSYIAWSPSLNAGLFVLTDQGAITYLKDISTQVFDEFQSQP